MEHAQFGINNMGSVLLPRYPHSYQFIVKLGTASLITSYSSLFKTCSIFGLWFFQSSCIWSPVFFCSPHWCLGLMNRGSHSNIKTQIPQYSHLWNAFYNTYLTTNCRNYFSFFLKIS